MSLLSILGKIGAIGAAPFTGGMSLGALPIIEGIGNALGSGAAASQAGRIGQADEQARMDALNNRAGLDAANHNMTTGATRLGQVQRADFAGNMHDTAPTGDPRIDKFGGGGLRPSTLGPDSHTAANEQKRQALAALMSGSDKFRPAISHIPDPGILETLGGFGGLAGGIAGVANNAMTARKPKLPVAPSPYSYGEDY